MHHEFRMDNVPSNAIFGYDHLIKICIQTFYDNSCIQIIVFHFQVVRLFPKFHFLCCVAYKMRRNFSHINDTYNFLPQNNKVNNWSLFHHLVIFFYSTLTLLPHLVTLCRSWHRNHDFQKPMDPTIAFVCLCVHQSRQKNLRCYYL